jgi:predicted O-linked N-acetylglucosamine transferase (SPINDLY family)
MTMDSLALRLSRAVALHRSGELAQAARLYREILDECPDTAPALTNLGSILRQEGQLEDAILHLQRAAALPHSNEHAAYNLGNALRAAGRHGESVAAFRLAVTRKPDWVLAYCNLGVALADAGDREAAEAALHQALVLEPGHALARDNLAALISSRLMRLQYQPMVEESILTTLALEYGALRPAAEHLPTRQRNTGEPLRVGFLSPDLCDHPVGMFLLPLLQYLDRQRIQPVLYSTGGRNDITRRALQQLGVWVDVAHLDDASLLNILRNHPLDALIDLSGHTAGHRLPVFARRAAPIQISWLGYFATTGVPAMDYVLMDEWHVPAGAELQFTEQVVRLPHSRFCYQPVAFAPEVSPPPCLSRGYVTFGSFNNTDKYHAGVFDLWARILASLPDARLVLKWRSYDDESVRARTLAAFLERGVAPDRIELRPFSFHVNLLKEYADVDIALDPFPFTGGQSSCEALWMGVPVVTLPGERPVSRQTYAFLSLIGLPGLVAQDEADYVRIVRQLAADPEQLQTLRHSLRGRMRQSPLCDAQQFAHTWASTLLDLEPRSKQPTVGKLR